MQPPRHAPEASGAADLLELDLRHLPAPEPMQRILDAIETLSKGQSLLARTPCRPQPLLDWLEADGYRVHVVVEGAGDAWVRISPGDGLANA